MNKEAAEFQRVMRAYHNRRIISANSKVLTDWSKLQGWGEPILVPCQPKKGMETALCFKNVERQVKQHGGSILFGWMFIEICDHAVHPEAHAVWLSEKKEPIDITPHDGSPSRILFCPDSRVETTRSQSETPFLMLSQDSRLQTVLSFEKALEDWVRRSMEALSRAVDDDIPDTDFSTFFDFSLIGGAKRGRVGLALN